MGKGSSTKGHKHVGHLNDVALSSVYSGFASFRGIKLVIFLDEINKLDSWDTNVGNGYSKALTKEKLYVKAGLL